MARSARNTLSAVLLIAASTLACRGGSEAPKPAPEASSPAAPEASATARPEIRQVILISLDTTRWDVVSSYGAREINSPNLDAFGRGNIVFERAYAPMPVTLPSHASMLTGLEPPAHGVLDNAWYSLADEHLTLAEVLRANGFNTGAFVSALVMESRFGLAQGFDTYDDDFVGDILTGERRGDLTTKRALQWLESHASERNFLFLHLFDPHAPYSAPEPFGSTIRESYQGAPRFIQDYVGEVAFADSCVGLVLEKLKELGLYEDSLVCITADHGESLGDHGELTHGFFIYSSTIQVPLMLKVPGTSKPSRVRKPVGIVDIFPTILSVLGISFEHQIQGHDLSVSLRSGGGLDPGRALFSMSLEPRKYGGSSLLGIIVGDFKYIQTTRPELYDLSRDAGEKGNILEKAPQRARALRARLGEVLDAAKAERYDTSDLDEVDARRLESLGYVVTGGPKADLALDSEALDPKDLIEYQNKAVIALSYVYPVRRDRAIVAAKQMIAMRPDFYLGYLMMGRILEASHRADEALPYFDKARALRPPGTMELNED